MISFWSAFLHTFKGGGWSEGGMGCQSHASPKAPVAGSSLGLPLAKPFRTTLLEFWGTPEFCPMEPSRSSSAYQKIWGLIYLCHQSAGSAPSHTWASSSAGKLISLFSVLLPFLFSKGPAINYWWCSNLPFPLAAFPVDDCPATLDNVLCCSLFIVVLCLHWYLFIFLIAKCSV